MQTPPQRRDMVDLIPEDRTVLEAPGADHRYAGVDPTGLDVAETVRQTRSAIPVVCPS